MRKQIFIWLSLFLLAVAGCQSATLTPAPPQVTRPGLTIYPSWTPTTEPSKTPVPSPTRTPVPSLTFTATLSPTPRQVPVYEPGTVISVDWVMDEGNNILHDLIVFTSAWLSPFNITDEQTRAQDGGIRLWAFSPDGRKSGRLTFDDVPFAAYFSSQAGQKPIFIEYGVFFNHPDVLGVQLPRECYGWLPEDEASLLEAADVEPCSDFRFSLDGRYVAFFFGPTVCSRGMLLLDTATSQTVFRTKPGTTSGFEFLKNGKLLYTDTHCEGGTLRLLDPATGESVHLGTLGEMRWNQAHDAFVMAVSPYHGASGAVWGYNVSSESIFLPEPETWELDDHAIWAPDGAHVLFQHRPLSISQDELYSFTAPRQIIRVDAQTGEQQVLAGDQEHDYHLCAAPDRMCDQWAGDWVQVRRYPFHAAEIPYTDDFYDDPRLTCLLYGNDCPFQAELLALNWRTGELVPWDASSLPVSTSASPTPTPLPGPDLSRTPVYADPDGKYAFYLGLDARSLWLVAADGSSELWVRDGAGFYYLP